MHAKVVEEAHLLVAGEKSLNKRADEFKLIIDGVFAEDESQNQNFRYLEFLNELKMSKLYDLTLDEYYDFLERHHEDDRAKLIHGWIGDIFVQKGDEKKARICGLFSGTLFCVFRN